MKIAFNFLGRRVFFCAFKTRKAYGIKSLLKNGHHIILIDVDSKTWDPLEIEAICEFLYQNDKWTWYPTDHGFHIIVWRQCPKWEAIQEMLEFPGLDLGWMGIGLKRGYWFLETPRPLKIPKEMKGLIQFMAIERGGEHKTRNTDLVR